MHKARNENVDPWFLEVYSHTDMVPLNTMKPAHVTKVGREGGREGGWEGGVGGEEAVHARSLCCFALAWTVASAEVYRGGRREGKGAR